jgi:hypothetical protein
MRAKGSDAVALAVELVGGPKDGEIVAVQSLRPLFFMASPLREAFAEFREGGERWAHVYVARDGDTRHLYYEGLQL